MSSVLNHKPNMLIDRWILFYIVVDLCASYIIQWSLQHDSILYTSVKQLMNWIYLILTERFNAYLSSNLIIQLKMLSHNQGQPESHLKFVVEAWQQVKNSICMFFLWPSWVLHLEHRRNFVQGIVSVCQFWCINRVDQVVI